METVESGKNALISSIEKDAQAEADSLVAEAEKQVSERRKYVEKQVASLVREAEEKAAKQSEAIKKKVLSGIDIEVKRRTMRAQNDLLNSLIHKVKEEVHSLVKKRQAYRQILQNWIVEAAIGLDSDSAEVNASKDERRYIDKKFLSEAEKRITSFQDRTVRLKLSDKPALQGQGVVLTAEDGQTAFNNQVTTRIRRKQREIQNFIYDTLLNEDREVTE